MAPDRLNSPRVPGPVAERSHAHLGSGAPAREVPPSFWALVPRRNLRRALFLILALGAVIALKRSGGGFSRTLVDSIAPRPAAPAGGATYHIQVEPVRR